MPDRWTAAVPRQCSSGRDERNLSHPTIAFVFVVFFPDGRRRRDGCQSVDCLTFSDAPASSGVVWLVVAMVAAMWAAGSLPAPAAAVAFIAGRISSIDDLPTPIGRCLFLFSSFDSCIFAAWCWCGGADDMR